MTESFEYGKFHARFRPDPDAYFRYHREHSRQYVAKWLSGVDRNAPVIDVGCGSGTFLAALLDCGFSHAIGIDTSTEQIRECQRLALPAVHVPNSFDFLTQQGDHFAVVVLLDVFEHVAVDQQFPLLQTIAASLKKGGLLLLRVPNANSAIASRMRYGDPTHTCAFTPESLSGLVEQTGLQVLEISDEIPYENRPSRLKITDKHTWVYFTYRTLIGFFRLWRRLELSAYVGFELGFRTPISPNFVLLAAKR